MDKVRELFNNMKSHNWDGVMNILINDPDNYIDINIKDQQDNYLLSYAVLFNRLEIIKLLVKKEVKIDIVDSDERSILYFAIKLDYIDIIEHLLIVNKDYIGISIIDIRDKISKIALHYAIEYKNLVAIKLMLEYGSNVNTTDDAGNNSLHMSVYSRNIDICKMILQYNININAKTQHGDTALHLACNLQEIGIIKLLLDNNKINVNKQDYERGFTPLHSSISVNNIIQIEMLLKHNADPNIQDAVGMNAIHRCIVGHHLHAFMTIIKNNKNIDYNTWTTDGDIPLHMVFETKPIDIDEYLNVLLEPSNLNIQNNDENSCLHFIFKNDIWKKYKNILKMKKLDITVKNKYGERPCDYIQKSSREEFIELLIESYLYRLRNIETKWRDEWENMCKQELYMENITKDEKEIIKKLNIKSKKDGDVCRNIIRERIVTIIDTKNETNIKSYPIKKEHTCIKITDKQQVGICTFTGTLLDILAGLLFLLKKHDYACSTINKEFKKNSELSGLYENINRGEFLNFEILWTHNKLYLHENFYENFKKCDNNNKKRFVIVPIGIEVEAGGHAGYFLYDKKTQEMERFEPHGLPARGFDYNANMLDNIMENKMKEINSEIKYIRPSDFLPKIGFQQMDTYEKKKKRIGDPEGFCAVWAIWYVDMRLTYKDLDRNTLVKVLIKDIKSKNISFKNMIRTFGQDITNLRDSILEKADVDINDWMNDQMTEKQIDIVTKEFASQLYQINH
jgi:ankyrin repeat protein